MGSGGAAVRKILCLGALVLAALGTPASAGQNAAALIAGAGLIGTWATDCAKDAGARAPGFRIILAHPPGGGLTYTTINVDKGVRMTIRSAILAAVPVGANRLRITFRIIGGTRNGGMLPSPRASTFAQTIEWLDHDRIALIDAGSGWLARCRN